MFFFFNDTATTEIYTLSLHDALPISAAVLHPGCGGERDIGSRQAVHRNDGEQAAAQHSPHRADRKSTRLNSSHGYISYAVFFLKKKKKHLSRPYRLTPALPPEPHSPR